MLRTENILMLEAIRAGIPSLSSVDKTIDLRDHLTSKILDDLKLMDLGETPSGRLVWGEYGQGKTHFLKLLEQQVLKHGYGVSYLSLSRQLNLSNMQNLFPALASHLKTPGNKIPGLLNPLTSNSVQGTDILTEISNYTKQISHPFPAWVLKAFLQYDPQNMITLYNTLMGKKENVTRSKSICREYFRTDFKTMPKFLMRDHMHSFFEFLPCLIRTLGFKGWVLLIDEFEITGKLGKVARLKSYQNLSWLMNLSKEHDLPLYCVVASVKTLQTDVFYGGKKDDARQMPIMAEERMDAKAALKIERFFKYASSANNIVLAPVPKKRLMELMNQFLEIHYQAVDWQFEVFENFVEIALKSIEYRGKPLRQILRLFIEMMDLYAINGELPQTFDENLMQDIDYEEDQSEAGLTETDIAEMFDQ